MKWNKNNVIITIACLIKLCMHLIADSNSGFQGDELLYIDSGNHLAFGYMEFPPLIGWLAHLQNLFGSTSVFIHHLFPHVASLLILILVALITIELGGSSKAVFISLLCVLVAPAFTRTHQLFQPVVFSQLFWILSFYQLVRLVKTSEKRYLLYLFIALGFGFLFKYDILFFMVGLPCLLLAPTTREMLLSKSSMPYYLIFMVIISPNVFWQVQNDFPVMQHMEELYQRQLNSLSIPEVLTDIFIELNPFTSIIYLCGLFYVISSLKEKPEQVISFSIVLSMVFLFILKGKAYYFFPIMIYMMIYGSVWLDKKIFMKRKWAIYPLVVLLILSGSVMVPYGMPILKLEQFISFAKIEKEDNRIPIAFEEFYSQYHWRNVLSSVQNIYSGLSEQDKKECLIWGKHYKQAGAINLFANKYEIPKAISYHGSYYTWSPDKGYLPDIMITISNKGVPKAFWENFFSSVIEMDKVHNLYADDDEDQWETVFICRHPKTNYRKLKESFKNRVFE